MAEPLLHVDNLGKRFGGFVALDGIDLSVQPGERLGLIGPNGSGKSTLVNCMCGTLHNETGTVRFDGQALDGLPANSAPGSGWRAASSCRGRFTRLSVAENLRIPLLYTAALAERPPPVAWRDREPLPRAAAPGRPRRQGAASCRATSPRSRCASSSSPAPWRPSRSC